MRNPSISERALELSTLDPRSTHDFHFFAQITISHWRKKKHPFAQGSLPRMSSVFEGEVFNCTLVTSAV